TLPPPASTLFPYTTLFRSWHQAAAILPWRYIMRLLDTVPDHTARAWYAQPDTPDPAQALCRCQCWLDVHVPMEDVVRVVRRFDRSEEHTSELQSRGHLVCR